MRTAFTALVFAFSLLVLPGAAYAAVTPEQYGAVGNGIADDTAALQSAVNSGQEVLLGGGKTYLISSRISVPSGARITATTTATVKLAATGFNNTDPAQLYGTKGVAFYINGGANVVLKGFTIVKPYDKTHHVIGIAVRNTDATTLEGLTLSGFSNAKGIISLISARGTVVRNNTIKDSVLDTTTLRSQLTGITVDDDRVVVNGTQLYSSNILITGNTIQNLTVTAASKAAFGYESDGITIANPNTSGYTIENNTITNVGEGIDMFGKNGTTTGNTITDTYQFGIKLIHGATGNMVKNNTITRAGLMGVIVSGADTGEPATNGNRFENNQISATGSSGAWSANDTAGIGITPGSATHPQVNAFKDNTVSGTSGMKYGLLCTGGSGNTFENTTITGATTQNILIFTGCGSIVTPPPPPPPPTPNQAKATFTASSYTLPALTNTKVPFNKELVDSANEYLPSTYRFTASTERVVNIAFALRASAAQKGKTLTLRLYKNGAQIALQSATRSGSTGALQVTLSAPGMTLAPGDYLEFYATNNQTGGMALSPNSEPYNYFAVTNTIATTTSPATTTPPVTPPPAPAPVPTCTLSASPTSITAGAAATLSWTTTHASSTSLNQGIGAVTPVASGSRSISPTATTTYTMTATNPAGSATCSTTVAVVPVPPPPPPTSATPTCTLAASPTFITAGGSTTLYWSTTNATAFSITPAPGAVTPVASGSRVVYPSASTVYVGTATGSGGTKTCTTSVTVFGGWSGGGEVEL